MHYAYPSIHSPINDDVLDVWQGNFKQEIERLSQLIEEYPIISIVSLLYINPIFGISLPDSSLTFIGYRISWLSG